MRDREKRSLFLFIHILSAVKIEFVNTILTAFQYFIHIVFHIKTEGCPYHIHTLPIGYSYFTHN